MSDWEDRGSPPAELCSYRYDELVAAEKAGMMHERQRICQIIDAHIGKCDEDNFLDATPFVLQRLKEAILRGV